MQQLVLLSRSGCIASGAEGRWKRITAGNVRVNLCDVGRDIEVHQSVDNAVAGIVHSAAVLANPLAARSQSQVAFERVWAPTVPAAWKLHQVVHADDYTNLHTFAVFSSIGVLLGSENEGNYAAASGCLDALTRYRHAQGLASVCIHWGAEMAGQSGTLQRLKTGAKEDPITETKALLVLEVAMRGAVGPVVGMATINWPVLLQQLHEAPPFLAKFQKHGGLKDNETGQMVQAAGFVASLAGLEAEALMEAVAAMVLLKVKEACGAVVSLHAPLMESGVDSLAATELRNSLQQELGTAVKLPSTVMFDYPTAAAIVEMSLKHITPASNSHEMQIGAKPLAARATVRGSHSCIPCGDNVWVGLTTGHNSVQQLPAERFDLQSSSYETLYVQQGHFVAGAELFDHQFFGMSSAEVKATDPSHRILLEAVLRASVQAGHSKGTLLSTTTGMFLGICNVWDWAMLQRDISARIGVFSAHGTDGGSAAGRVSYLFGLKGPCFSVNTACSSSLVALNAACQNLQQRTCMRAIVAGVCLQLHAWSFGAFCALHALSADGQCKTFDARADGYGRSEMCGGIVLEHESAIVTIGGSAVNQDGRSASFMAPNGPSQEEVVQAAMLDAQELGMDCIEAHGTGTALGDPIEVGALHRVLQSESVVLGAIKSQMAHSEGAAGMAGLMQALLVLQHACVSPSLHLQQANSKMELQGFVVQMPSQGTCFLSVNRMQRMGVSSFGFSGTNSHAMVLGRGIATCIGELVVVSCLETSAFSWWQRSDALGAARVLGTVVSNHTLPPGSDTVWERSWPQAICCYMAHHRVGCTPVAPGTGYLQLAIAASRHSADTGDGVQINETKFKAMLFLDGLTPTIRVTAAASSVLFDSSQHEQWTRNDNGSDRYSSCRNSTSIQAAASGA